MNKGTSYSVNTGDGTPTGKNYEFLMQKLTLNNAYAQDTKIFGLDMVFEPDKNGTMDIDSESYFSVTKNSSMTF